MLNNQTLKYEYTTRVEFSHAIGQHNILLRCLPAHEGFQKSVEENFRLLDGFWFQEGQDGLGNRIISGGTSAEHRSLEYSSCGIMEMTTYCIPDVEAHPAYRLPSRLTPSVSPTRGGTMWEEMRLPSFDTKFDGNNFLQECLCMMHFVHEFVTYESGMTDMLTTAEDTFRSRRGVCQDFAHLMIALCRQRGMAARYVCGLMKGEGKTHAWVEVHDGQCWYAFDPTNDTAIATGYIKLAHGRDALDCPVVRGVYRGMCTETSITNVIVSEK